MLSQAIHIPVVLPSYPIKMLDQSVQGFQSYDRIYKLTTNITTLYINIYIDQQEHIKMKHYFLVTRVIIMICLM